MGAPEGRLGSERQQGKGDTQSGQRMEGGSQKVYLEMRELICLA